MSVGAASSDHLTQDEYERIRTDVEAFILSQIPNGTRPYRDMLERIPGELFPRWTPCLAAGTFSFTVSIGDMLTDPAPVLWLDQKRDFGNNTPTKQWRDRWRVDESGTGDLYWKRLVSGTDYTISGNIISGVSMAEKDRLVVEYSHDLSVTPGILKSLSIGLTVHDCLIAVMGRRNSVVDNFAEQFARAFSDLDQLTTGAMGIAEFDALSLYEDYRESQDGPVSVKVQRS